MRRARALAEDAAHAKADFLANMSHEIRTPMNAIMGMTHLVLRTELNPKQRDYLTKVESAGQHLLGIINDVLDFSKIEAGKLSVDRIAFDLQKVLDNVADLVAERCAAKGIELIVKVAPGVPPRLVGDPLRISQILINYANNAVKFTEAGEIAVEAAVDEVLGEDTLLRFTVRDTGIGIDDHQREILFRAFQQADGSTTRKYGGTGLGLAISRQLANLMGGAVGVDSAPGRGSTFWFTARVGSAPAEPAPMRPDLGGSAKPASAVAGARVLLVEDNELNQEVAIALLREIGVEPRIAADGAAAVAMVAASAEPYDLVLMDMQMPVMDGLSATRRLRRMPEGMDLPIVAMTANALPADRERCFEAGMNDHLVKPIRPTDLLEKLQRWTRPRPARAPLPPAPTGSEEMPLEPPLLAIPGLDAAAGLASALGRPSLYRSVLRKFARGQARFGAGMAEALDRADRIAAERLAHTLKGVAAQIGAATLRDRAELLELAIRTQAPVETATHLVDECCRLLAPLLDALGRYDAGHAAPAPAVNPHPTAFRELRDRLIDMLARDDFACARLFEQNRALLEAGLGAEFATFAQAIENFDFALAQRCLARA